VGISHHVYSRFYHDAVSLSLQLQLHDETTVHLRQLLVLLKSHEALKTTCGDTDLLWFLVKVWSCLWIPPVYSHTLSNKSVNISQTWNLGVQQHASKAGAAKSTCALAMQYLQLLSAECQELLSARMTRDFGLISVTH
jgi:hypothetical protein